MYLLTPLTRKPEYLQKLETRTAVLELKVANMRPGILIKYTSI